MPAVASSRRSSSEHAEIDRPNASFGGRVYISKGIEFDILPDGSLDYPEDVLRRFDLIIGSIHGQFRLDREAQTERLVRAASNPFVTVIGHMAGRQLLRHPGYDVDIERVLAPVPSTASSMPSTRRLSHGGCRVGARPRKSLL